MRPIKSESFVVALSAVKFALANEFVCAVVGCQPIESSLNLNGFGMRKRITEGSFVNMMP